MYFNKYPYKSNFEFLKNGKVIKDAGFLKGEFKVVDFKPCQKNPYGEREININCQRYAGDIFYFTVSSDNWRANYAQSELLFPEKATDGQISLDLDEQFNITFFDHNGDELLQSAYNKGFGIGGNASIYMFKRNDSDRFYGMGEKMFPLERSGIKTKFWNTDVFADFSRKEIEDGITDPMYVSVPYLIIKRRENYIGLLLDNPYATFIDTDSNINIANQMDTAVTGQNVNTFSIGAEHGQPNLIIIYGPTLNELTCKLQKIVGVTPLPPVWALGYNQCRWGYQSYADLKYIDSAMNKFNIPCDAIWLDIEYMRGYRVFTFEEEKNFPDLENNLNDIQGNGGRRVVPIIDPGVKAERGYETYESGHEANIFCKNPQGQEFIGLVWPGETVFPDYSTEAGRNWWSSQIKSFAEKGITAAWLDMNDPSVGTAPCQDMLFDGGKNSHYTYHNQYGMGMAKASHAGFAAAYPDSRPFLLCRSGFTGSSKYSAIWTGDNVSNYHYLEASIPCTLNLGLSGIPFNGPDAGGFAGESCSKLMVDWFKAGFLFPFLRNHTMLVSEDQEPWVYGKKTLDILRHYIRMRYMLRPYLYNLFAVHEKTGAAIMRPLFYDFAGSDALPLDCINDQFMVGQAIMQAPFVEEDAETRNVTLPDANWYSPMDNQWLNGNCVEVVHKFDQTTPIYFREGSIVPMVPEVEGSHKFDGATIRFHLFFNHKSDMTGEYTYIFDDGQTLEYKNGKRSCLRVLVKAKNDELVITTELLENGYGSCRYDFAVYNEFSKITVNGKVAQQQPFSMRLVGNQQQLFLLANYLY